MASSSPAPSGVRLSATFVPGAADWVVSGGEAESCKSWMLVPFAWPLPVSAAGPPSLDGVDAVKVQLTWALGKRDTEDAGTVLRVPGEALSA